MSIYLVLPSHHNLTHPGIKTTSIKIANQIAKEYRDNYHMEVSIYKDNCVVSRWRRDQSGDGSNWMKVNP